MLWSMGSPRVIHDILTEQQQQHGSLQFQAWEDPSQVCCLLITFPSVKTVCVFEQATLTFLVFLFGVTGI